MTGVIRLSAPVTFGEMYVGAMLGRFAALHPGLTFDLRLNDRYADLASEGIDLAFRIGQTGTLSLKARKLGEVHSLLVASPAYLAAHGAPGDPVALTGHSCILDSNRQSPRRWVFRDGTAEQVVQVQGRFQVNSARAAVELAAAGLGIAYAPRFAVCDALASGALVPVLPKVQSESAPLRAVYLEGRALPRKLRALIDFAAEDIRAADIL